MGMLGAEAAGIGLVGTALMDKVAINAVESMAKRKKKARKRAKVYA